LFFVDEGAAISVESTIVPFPDLFAVLSLCGTALNENPRFKRRFRKPYR
jgi:hypothetical protein